VDEATLERAKRPNIVVGHAIVADAIAALEGPFALVSRPSALALVAPAVVADAAVTVTADSLDEAFLERAASSLPDVATIVGLGGGTALDMAKFLAWRSGAALVQVPSIVSVDASVTNTVAIRRGGQVSYEGFVVADPVIVDLELIAQAPARFNRAGVGDLLSIQTARVDWALGHRAGKIDFDAAIDAAAAAVLADLYDLADEVARVSDRAIEHIVRAYAEVNALLIDAGHSGPEEGSEHYFAYAAEAVTSRSFVHGEIIGLGVVLMSGLQGNEQARAADYLDRCQVEWRPAQLGLDRELLATILAGLPAFVRDTALPYSVIDEQPLDSAKVRDLLDSIPA
jgi:glycerol-1-phosphate dehydrogenase [NAD(P)+]